jgi:hypothetical protein
MRVCCQKGEENTVACTEIMRCLRSMSEALGRWNARWAVALQVALALMLGGAAGCSRVGLPAVGLPGSGNEGTAALVENRVWIDAGADAAPGSLRAFLADGTLVMTSCAEVYRLAPWRWIEGSTMVWEEDGATVRAEVVMAERQEMVLALELAGETVTRTFRAAEAPVVCPEFRG